MKGQLSQSAYSATRAIVSETLINYWHDVDRNDGINAPDYYTEDAKYLMCGRLMIGPEDVRRYYEYRKKRGDRLVRHVISNLRVIIVDENRARLTAVLCLYASDGLPVLPSGPPNMVADTDCEFERGDDGHWRFLSHKIVPLFSGGVEVLMPPTS